MARGRPDSPCRDCLRRYPGCHNADTCEAWMEYQEEQKKYKAHWREHIVGNRDERDLRYETCQKIEKRRARRWKVLG